MFVERDQIAAPLQGCRDPLDALVMGGKRSHSVGGPQRIDLEILVGELPGDRQRPIGVLGCLWPVVGIEIDMAMGRDQRSRLAAAIAEFYRKLARAFEGLQRLRNGGSVIAAGPLISAPAAAQAPPPFAGPAPFSSPPEPRPPGRRPPAAPENA